MANAEMGTMPTIFTFQNGKPHPIRIYNDEAGEPLFHAGDLCELLEHGNPHQALRTHVEKDDLQKMEVTDRLGRKQQANFVREAGMWSLLIGSHAPNAKKVKRWITSEVLPALRKTGRYEVAAPPAPSLTPQQMRQLSEAVQGALAGMDDARGAVSWAINRLRVRFSLARIDLLTPEQLPLALAECQHMQRELMAWFSFRAEMREFVEQQIIGAGTPWTAALARQWRQKMQQTLPTRPDWLRLRDEHSRAVSVS